MDADLKRLLAWGNQQSKELNAVYHQAAAGMGLSDTALWVLYALWDAPEGCSQNELAEGWYYPKQTVNSAVGGLTRDGLVRLEAAPGRGHRKLVRLTAEGRAFCQAHILPLMEAEGRALARLPADEREHYLQLTEKHLHFLKEEIGVLQ